MNNYSLKDPAELLRVTNHAGRAFNIRVVFAGMKYGREDCLRHDGRPMIEFYDATYQDAPGFGPRGQFVTRYYADTLASHPYNAALMLDGGVPEWRVSCENVRAAIAHCLSFETTRASLRQ